MFPSADRDQVIGNGKYPTDTGSTAQIAVCLELYSDIPVQDAIVQFTMDIHCPADAKKRRG